MAEYSRLATGSVVSTGGQTAVVLPFIPNYIEFTNPARITADAGGVTKAWWYSDFGSGAAAYVTTSAYTFATTPAVSFSADTSHYLASGTTGGFTTIYAGLALQYGATTYLGASGGIALTSSTLLTVTTTAAHGLTTGDWVTFQNLYETSTTGMQQIAGIPFVVTVTGTTTFTITWNGTSTGLTAITAGGLNTNASFKQITYPVLYAPGTAVIWALTLGTTTTVFTTAPHNFVVGQEIGFRIPTTFGTTGLNELPNTTIPGQPQYGFVTSVVSDTEFVCNINSSAFTAFNTNQAFTAFSGLTFPQVFAVGDVNTGGLLYSGGLYYPSPTVFNGYTSSTSTGVSTINGPAIYGAYYNATFQGFIIGSTISGTSGDVLYWKAELMDYAT